MKPQAAYAAFIGDFKSKFTHFLWTVPDIDEYFQLIEDTIANKFIPAISGGSFVNDVERKLISLPTRYGGLAMPIIKDIAKMEYANSRRITEELALSINNQDLSYNVDTSNIKKIQNLLIYITKFKRKTKTIERNGTWERSFKLVECISTKRIRFRFEQTTVLVLQWY